MPNGSALPDDEPALSLGRLSEPITLGKYKLLKKIAAGGMAEIFVAKVSGLPGFEKIVVVKRILPQLASNREFIQMFLDEARIAATLQHPNIVQMYDIGAIDGNYFISMEYLHGEDTRMLMKTLRRQAIWLPLEQALHIVIGVAAGLHYAHEKLGFDGRALGIVHRDVTPQNVIVTYDGAVKVVDFGIAKATNRYNETRYGTLKGKIPYMSPEQCKSEPLDRRSDIYSIGILLYELTTARRLYKGASDFEILKQIVERPVVPPSAFLPDYPRDLDAIVMRALAKRREDRYQSAQELQADLEHFTRESRLVVSTIAMSAFMERVFGDKLTRWREALAQGKDLALHIPEKHELSHDTDEESQADKAAWIEGLDDGTGTRPTVSKTGGRARARRIRRRRMWLGGGLVGGAALATVLALIAGGSSKQDASAAGAVAGSGATSGTGTASIETDPPGALVLVDEKEWPHHAPTVVEELSPGPHVVTLRLDKYQERKVKFEVTGGQATRLLIEMEPSLAVVSLAPPAGAAPAEAPPGGAPAPGIEPSPGTSPSPSPGAQPPPGEPHERGKPPRHPIEPIRGKPPRPGTPPGHPPATPPAAATPAGEGELRIASMPSCEVMIDGRARGSTPLTGVKLSAGKHRVQLINSRYGIDESYTVDIAANEVTKKKYDFPVDD